MHRWGCVGVVGVGGGKRGGGGGETIKRIQGSICQHIPASSSSHAHPPHPLVPSPPHPTYPHPSLRRPSQSLPCPLDGWQWHCWTCWDFLQRSVGHHLWRPLDLKWSQCYLQGAGIPWTTICCHPDPGTVSVYFQSLFKFVAFWKNMLNLYTW